MEEDGGLPYCPTNVSLASISQGNISTCFIDTVINPLLVLVAAAAEYLSNLV